MKNIKEKVVAFYTRNPALSLPTIYLITCIFLICVLLLFGVDVKNLSMR